LDTERLLFSSGYPGCNPATKVAAAKWELRDQSDVVKQKIFCENAAKLVGEVKE
jgi:predicted TIM-barrel fold metal-dependent hydrolase